MCDWSLEGTSLSSQSVKMRGSNVFLAQLSYDVFGLEVLPVLSFYLFKRIGIQFFDFHILPQTNYMRDHEPIHSLYYVVFLRVFFIHTMKASRMS